MPDSPIKSDPRPANLKRIRLALDGVRHVDGRQPQTVVLSKLTAIMRIGPECFDAVVLGWVPFQPVVVPHHTPPDFELELTRRNVDIEDLENAELN